MFTYGTQVASCKPFASFTLLFSSFYFCNLNNACNVMVG